MTLDYTVCGKVHITMIDFLDKVFIAFDKVEPKWGGTKTSAEPENIFKVDKYCKKLPQSKTVQFHNLVENTLYATKRSRLDTCTKQKLNTCSSTDTELVGADEFMPEICWTRYFFKAQG